MFALKLVYSDHWTRTILFGQAATVKSVLLKFSF